MNGNLSAAQFPGYRYGQGMWGGPKGTYGRYGTR